MGRLSPTEFRFFYFRGRFHALTKSEPQFVALCGVSPLGGAKTRVVDCATASFPPDICSQCLLEVGVTVVDEEPIEEALSRGFLPSSEVL